MISTDKENPMVWHSFVGMLLNGIFLGLDHFFFGAFFGLGLIFAWILVFKLF